MLTFASLLAAMTIAGAFWVGVLAARRLRDWGEGRRALEEGSSPLALAPAGAPPDDPRTRKVRELVAQQLHNMRYERTEGRTSAAARADAADLDLYRLRVDDVVIIESGDPDIDGDYVLEGLVHLREGGKTIVVAVVNDAGRQRWIVGGEGLENWIIAEPVVGHALSGEPSRQIRHRDANYTLTRRGQASVALTGQHGRPEASRAATYLYHASGRDVLWLERWGQDVLMGVGRTMDPADIRYLPGS
jgi:hypothetical protein